MRITSGIYSSRTLEELPVSNSKARKLKFETRPTSDRVRQAVFNILNHANWDMGDGIDFNIREAYALDVFAGTGALGIEALSNGAIDCCFFEVGAKAYQICQENVTKFDLQDKSYLFKIDSLNINQRPDNIPKRNLVFLDPPYGENMVLDSIKRLQQNDWVSDNAILILEEDKSNIEEMPPELELLNTKNYGKTSVRFFRA